MGFRLVVLEGILRMGKWTWLMIGGTAVAVFGALAGNWVAFWIGLGVTLIGVADVMTSGGES